MAQKTSKVRLGFTLIELMVVISIIGLLSSIILASLNAARAKARDIRRMQDLNQIRTAMFLYYDTNKNWIETGSGCGYSSDGSLGNSTGNGFFNYTSVTYPKSIVQCLIDASALSTEIIDPTGGRSESNPTNNIYAYMKCHCNTPRKVYIYAKLETKAQDATALNGTCCYEYDSDWGMNYYVQVQ